MIDNGTEGKIEGRLTDVGGMDMVSAPEPAPESQPSERTFRILLQREELPGLDALLLKANREYLYWDKFKHLPMPDGLTAEDAWAVLKLVRSLNRRNSPIRDVHGHVFWYSLTDGLQRSLMLIDQQAGGRIGTRVPEITPDVQRTYLLSRLMEEAIASSQIEGAATTRRDAKEMLRTGRKPSTRGERMILNNYRTIQQMRGTLDRDLSLSLLLELQSSLTEGTLSNASESGRFRTEADDDIVVGDFTGKVVHVPPKAHELPAQLKELCRFANREEEHFVHPVLKAVLLHFWLAYLHPFCDGNGRTARALFYWFSLKSGYWLFEYVSISRVIMRRRAQYERAFLYSEADDADVTYFATFHLNAIKIALDEFWEYVERKTKEDGDLQRQVSLDSGLNYRQRAVLTRAIKDSASRFTIESHRASHDVAYATARADLIDLVERGYLVQVRQGRAYVFAPAPDLRHRLAEE